MGVYIVTYGWGLHSDIWVYALSVSLCQRGAFYNAVKGRCVSPSMLILEVSHVYKKENIINCGVLGFYLRGCPNIQSQCTYCSDADHTVEECPHLIAKWQAIILYKQKRFPEVESM